jgi:3',5'-cyclic AMP phosphodiesterase CpdA
MLGSLLFFALGLLLIPYKTILQLLTGILLMIGVACTHEIPVVLTPVDLDPEVTLTASEKFRVVFLADTHIIGPNYTCCENSPRDTLSLYHTQDRLLRAQQQINRLRPQPDFAVVLGDVVHDAYPEEAPLEAEYYLTHETAMGNAAKIFQGFDMPVYFLWGNHDYNVPRIPQPFSHQLFQTFFQADPYTAIDHKGWKFILANSELGPTWDPNSSLYNRSLASYGREQLAWIDTELSEGKPTVLLFHYPLLQGVTQRYEDPAGFYPDLPTLVATHPNRAVFALSGHLHHWLNFFDRFGVPHWVIGATRYDADNFWVVEFDQRSYRILNDNKAHWGRKTADAIG